MSNLLWDEDYKRMYVRHNNQWKPVVSALVGTSSTTSDNRWWARSTSSYDSVEQALRWISQNVSFGTQEETKIPPIEDLL